MTTNRTKSPIEKTLKRLNGDTSHAAPVALLFSTLAWVHGWSQPISANFGANSWWAFDPNGKHINIRYSHNNKIVELWLGGIRGKLVARFNDEADVLKFFKVKP